MTLSLRIHEKANDAIELPFIDKCARTNFKSKKTYSAHILQHDDFPRICCLHLKKNAHKNNYIYQNNNTGKFIFIELLKCPLLLYITAKKKFFKKIHEIFKKDKYCSNYVFLKNPSPIFFVLSKIKPLGGTFGIYP